MKNQIKALSSVIIALLCSCQPDMPARYKFMHQAKEIKENQRRTKERVIETQNMIREIDSLIYLYEHGGSEK